MNETTDAKQLGERLPKVRKRGSRTEIRSRSYARPRDKEWHVLP